MKGENHRLRDMLEQVNSSYNALKMHMMNSMKDQKRIEEVEEHEHEVFDESSKGKKQTGCSRGPLVPRQFIDLGLASIDNGETDSDEVEADASLSSSVGRSHDRSGSPGNNVEVASKEFAARIDQDRKKYGKGSEVEEDADQIPKFSPPKNVDEQVEATMRKARVSVRARSEATMVSQSVLIN